MIEIQAPRLSHVTFIGANMRPTDVAEFEAAHGHGRDVPALLAQVTGMSAPWAYTVTDDDQPIFCFGVLRQAMAPQLAAAWGFGTRRARRAIPAVSDFIDRVMVPGLLDAGVHRVEVRVMARALSSVTWLADYMGAQFEASLSDHGTNRETFYQYSWTRTHFEKGLPAHVFPKDAPSARASQNGVGHSFSG